MIWDHMPWTYRFEPSRIELGSKTWTLKCLFGQNVKSIYLITLFEDHCPDFSEGRSYCSSFCMIKRVNTQDIGVEPTVTVRVALSLHPAARHKTSVKFLLFAFQEHKKASQYPRSQQVTSQKLTTDCFHWQFLYCLNTAQCITNRIRNIIFFLSVFDLY